MEQLRVIDLDDPMMVIHESHDWGAALMTLIGRLTQKQQLVNRYLGTSRCQDSVILVELCQGQMVNRYQYDSEKQMLCTDQGLYVPLSQLPIHHNFHRSLAPCVGRLNNLLSQNPTTGTQIPSHPDTKLALKAPPQTQEQEQEQTKIKTNLQKKPTVFDLFKQISQQPTHQLSQQSHIPLETEQETDQTHQASSAEMLTDIINEITGRQSMVGSFESGTESEMESFSNETETSTSVNLLTSFDSDASCDTETLELLMAQMESSLKHEQNTAKKMKEQVNSQAQKLGQFTRETYDQKRELVRQKEKEEDRKRIFVSDRDNVYMKFMDQVARGVAKLSHPPLPFVKKFPIFRFLDDNGLLGHEKDYSLYLILSNLMYTTTADGYISDDDLVPQKINYLDQKRLDELYDETREFDSIINEFKDWLKDSMAPASKKQIPSYEEVMAELGSESDEVDSEKQTNLGPVLPSLEPLSETDLAKENIDIDNENDSLDEAESTASSEPSPAPPEMEQSDQEIMDKKSIVNRLAQIIDSSQ